MKKISFFIDLNGGSLKDIFQYENLKNSLPHDLQKVKISLVGDFAKIDAELNENQKIHLPLFGNKFRKIIK